MVRHLMYCRSRQIEQPNKKQKTSSSAEEENSPDLHINETLESVGAAEYGIATANHGSEVWLASDESSVGSSQYSDDKLSSNDIDMNNNTKTDCTFSIENELHKRTQKGIVDRQHQFEMDILGFCKKIDAPLYAYDDLMKILQKHDVTKHIVPGEINSKSSLENIISKKYEFLKGTEPKIKRVELEDGKQVEVVTFDFLSMLTSLLNDERCMDDSCLTFPGDNPYSSPKETGIRDEFHTGSWYQQIWKNRWEKEGDLILGLVFFIDKTFTDVYGRLNLLPVQFTITMFNRDTRSRYHAWRPLGYINDLKLSEENSDTRHPTALRSERNLRNFHNILRVIMESVKEVQDSDGVSFMLMYKGSRYNLNLIPVIGPIIGDSEEHDVLVGRYGSYNRVKRICRYCDCSFFDSDNPFYEYNYTKQEDIKMLSQEYPELIGRKKLNDISYHHINNAFHCLDFGDDERGLHGLCPAEILHCVRLGLFKMAVTCFYNFLQPRHKSELDKVVTILKHQFKHQSDRCVPRTTFTFMISDLTKITAGEWIGIVLLLTASLLTRAGVSIWRSTAYHDAIKNDYIKLFDRLLILDEWLRNAEGFRMEELEIVRGKLLNFLGNYKRICRRREGNEMKILKYHLMTHIIDDIERLGSPQNVNGGPCESNFVPQKKEAKRTQRRNENFLHQIAKRMHENLLFAHAAGKDTEKVLADAKQGGENVPIGGSKFDISLNCYTREPYVDWKRGRNEEKGYQEEILQFVHNELTDDENDVINCFTEHKVNGRIFRADCSYRGGAAWYDWVSVIWQTEDDRRIEVFAKLHMFVDCRNKIYNPPKIIRGIEVRGRELYAVLSSLKEERPVERGVSQLFLQGTLYKENGKIVYYVVPVETLNETAVVIQDIDENLDIIEDAVLIMRPCAIWKNGINVIDIF